MKKQHSKRVVRKSVAIINGTIHAPFFIFIRCASCYSDVELLRRLGLERYQRIVADLVDGRHEDGRHEFSARLDSNHITITDDEKWVHIADDWLYTLWGSPSVHETVARLASDYDVFSCSVGDSDQSYEFTYYRDSQRVRRYVVEDPHYLGGEVTEDIGEPLPGEPGADENLDEFERMMLIAASIGIDVKHDPNRLRIYLAQERQRSETTHSAG